MGKRFEAFKLADPFVKISIILVLYEFYIENARTASKVYIALDAVKISFKQAKPAVSFHRMEQKKAMYLKELEEML